MEWLEDNEFGEDVISAFATHNITGHELHLLTDSVLQDSLDVESAGIRAQLLHSVEALRPQVVITMPDPIESY
ncbi:hypothetical protein HDU76_011267 [Blyttiomyces sp. JEL0837]|nr:hypothetical protein HDU76_011267 [Blyttiomyces sp. JEL0837]